MFEISVEQHFDAAHCLRGYQGKCEALHGHRFKVIAMVKADKLDKIGMAYDFTVLKKRLWDVMGRFDHANLNELSPFDKINPSSENIAEVIYRELKLRLRDEQVNLAAIEVWESPENRVVYRPD